MRDIARDPPPFVSEAWMEGAFASADVRSPAALDALAISDGYVNEVLCADHIVIGTPMYNFGCPAVLKAWVDQVVRVNRTVRIVGGGFAGLATGTSVSVLVACSGDPRPTTRGAATNFLEPYLRSVLAFIGIDDVDFVYAHSQNPMTVDDAQMHADRALSEARATIEQLVARTAERCHRR